MPRRLSGGLKAGGVSEGEAGELLGAFDRVRARKEARGALSDVDIIVFAEGARRLCCWGLPYECDLMFVKPEEAYRRLEAGFIALIEGLWHGVWICRDEKAGLVEEAWREFLQTHVVVRKGDYWVVRRRERP